MNFLSTFFRFLFFIPEIIVSLSKGAVSSNIRIIDPKKPLSWEFSCFSQNGEDGIVDYLSNKIISPNKYFIEIGTANGLANNTAYFAFVKKFSGLMLEGSKLKSYFSKNTYRFFNAGVESINMFVSLDNFKLVLSRSVYNNPDIFSIDIDGNDYYILKNALMNSFRPSIIIVEYNSNFGPIDSITIKYDSNFDYSKAHPSRLYYGVSIQAWKNLLCNYNYEFVTVDSNGINAIFINKDSFPVGFCNDLEGCNFLDNKIELQMFKMSWENRFKLIKDMPFESV